VGFFAVLAEEGDQPKFEVKKLDINVWCLQGLFGRTTILCDVGIRVRPEASLARLAVGIPFGTTSESLFDLTSTLRDSASTTSLVFGRPCTPERRGNRTIVSDDGVSEMAMASIERAKTERDEGRSNGNFSLWHLAVAGGLPTDIDSYVRVRFAVDSLGRAWTWRRSMLVRRNATVDLRVCDLRETQTVPDGNDYEQRLVPIEQLNCFVIVPSSFRPSRSSPATRYVRLLEGRLWERYLHRATDLRRSGKLGITYWRPDGPIKADNEFRAFMDLRREGWTEVLATFALALAAVLTGIALLVDPKTLSHSPLITFVNGAWGLTGIKLSVGVGVVLTVGSRLPLAFKAGRQRVWQIRRRLRRLEQDLYRLRGKSK
jgi:hypothetical protein